MCYEVEVTITEKMSLADVAKNVKKMQAKHGIMPSNSENTSIPLMKA